MADETGWYVGENGNSQGPMSLDEVAARVSKQGPGAMVYGPGMTQWAAAGQVPQLSSRVRFGAPPPVPPVGAGGRAGHMKSHEIDYQIHGAEMQYVEVTLDPGETV